MVEQAVKANFNLQEEYDKYRKKDILVGAVQGQVCTRFPPEPSGYLHIGHIKAVMINYHYSKMYDGKMIFRFDDTNPSKEKCEFVQAIEEDLKMLGIKWDKQSNTSDYFDLFITKAKEMISLGLAYCDNTDQEKMQHERTKMIMSKYRDTTPQQNLEIFQQMVDQIAPAEPEAGKPIVLTDIAKYCLRAKIDYQSKNGTLRDPVIFRSNFTPHHKTGKKYKIYPTYDFACPIIDSIEGVTHAMRSQEYMDRIPQYHWFIEQLKLRPVQIWEFSRLNFKSVVMSKRKLQWFVDTKRVEGWDDPRMPTVRGIIRRGLRIETLTQFMLEQGPSKAINLQEWDKIWAMNKKIIDPIAPRFMFVKEKGQSSLKITNFTEEFQSADADINPINPAMGKRKQRYNCNIILTIDDAKSIEPGQKVVLINVGMILINTKTQTGDSFELTGEYLKDDKDFSNKLYPKLTWLCKDAKNVLANLIELDHLITKDKIEEEDDIEKVVNEKSKIIYRVLIDEYANNLKRNDVLQVMRMAYFKVDEILEENGQKVLNIIFTPDGSKNGITSKFITTEVDQDKLRTGKDGVKKQEENKEPLLSQKQKKKLEKEAKSKQDPSVNQNNEAQNQNQKPGQQQVEEQKVQIQIKEVQQPQKQQQKQKQNQSQDQNLNLNSSLSEFLPKLNSILSQQQFLSQSSTPSGEDVEAFLKIKSQKWDAEGQQKLFPAVYSWYSWVSQFNLEFIKAQNQKK